MWLIYYAFVHLGDSLAIANTDIYFISAAFRETIRDWNALSDSLISSAEGAEDGVHFSGESWGTNRRSPGPGE